MSKRQNDPDWFVSSFSGSSSHNPEKPAPRKRVKKNESSVQNPFDGDSTWIEKYMPKTKACLAVHKKKVEDLSRMFALGDSELKRAGGRIILLTGPAGCGKTATINVIANELSLELYEWVNPVDRAVGSFDETEKLWSGDTVYAENQSSAFRDFLFRTSRYSLAGSKNRKPKVLLIEDLPNIFYRDPSELHQILRQFRSTAYVVFIISDSSGKDTNIKKIFPPDAIKDLRIEVVNFNPITTASLVRVLERILVSEGSVYTSKQSLEALAESSGCDVRAAVNALQFACLKGCSGIDTIFKSKPPSGKSKRKSPKKNPDPPESGQQVCLASIGGRDATLFLFHVLGKVLYAKRESERGYEPFTLPHHLSSEQRCPLQTVPEQLLDKSAIHGSTLALFLHQNFPPFFEKLEDYSKAAESLSYGDYIAGEWKDSRPDIMEEYYGLISVRGLMNANTQVAGGKWRAMHRPKWYEMARDLKRREHSLREEFCVTSGLTSHDVIQDVLPYAKNLGVRFSPAGQRLATDLTSFKLQPLFQISRPNDVLDEVDMDETEEADFPDVVDAVDEASKEDEETPEEQEDFVIEDYDAL